ncbi:hypothetical protein SAMN05444280_1372 [Tangfeifania diversioriginum]|uniref:Uncharacterized protein n=1 Tax=Tangfeifania diversioriginum TaxID=1168035 RepID=A0A1M6MX62_9BACT|nr:hypothetical protein [Tangfeifania diversioriginum]SHJ88012.1 hypothetical protein SAMN05444280_1372 [Tangfeifania diversioriginum]
MKIYRYDAEYANEVMEEIPPGYIDKTVCGCGLTSVALENDVNTIIAVPTIYLAINKAEQYPNERFDGDVLAVWGETELGEIEFYRYRNQLKKIVVTYDSLPKVKYLLEKYDYKLVIDESNELLSKTKLKTDVITTVFEIAEEYKESVSFISATPTPLQYLPNWVSEIDQIKIEWANTIKAQPILAERTFPYKSLRNEFIAPLNQNGEMTLEGRKFSKVIVFINSVRQISNVVKEAGLKKEECGIICGNSLKNDSRIIGIPRYVSGEMPRFLFITSSGFSGIDLYDSQAMTVVVSNTRKSWQMIDMLTDLKQAISRQRNKNNPNYGTFIYIYNQSMFRKTKDELLAKIEEVRDKISNTIYLYEKGLEEGKENGIEFYPDFEAYTLIKDGRYVINEEAFKADKYFILEIREQYSKGFDIKSQFNVSSEIEPIILPGVVTYTDLVDYFKENHKNGAIEWGVYSTKTEWICVIETCYKYYKKVWKDYTYANTMITNYGDAFEIIASEAHKVFGEGIYTRKDAKAMMQNIYDELQIPRKAKHHDFNEIFKKVEHPMINGERHVRIKEK